ncbi:uncharacterized protein [Arachis hypogaea]|uniref:uncharacterized protein isoform X2 n=1 Tax=Arachis hypogaea TaxID=3818 RepID=UPI0011056F50|nr:uncharacterized protein LOC112762493 isoform X2 [Arachis hypogaea]
MHRPFLPFLTATTALNRGALLDGRGALLDRCGAQSQETPLPSHLLLVLPLFLRFQLGDLKLEELLSTPPPGTDEIVAISKAIIKLDNDGSFYIKNLGKTTILVNNKEVQTGQSQRLHSNCLIEDEDAIEVTPGLEIGKTLQLMCARRRLVNLWESFLLKLISPRIPQNNKCDPSVYGVLYLFVTQPTKLGPITLPCVPNFTTYLFMWLNR